MKTIRKIIKDTVDQTLEEHGILAGDLSEVLSDKIWTAIQERKERKGEACPIEWMSALMRLCGVNVHVASVALRSQISECGKASIQSGAELDDLTEFSHWWKNFSRSWSFPHDYPTPKQIRDNWGKFQQGQVPHVQDEINAARATQIYSQRL